MERPERKRHGPIGWLVADPKLACSRLVNAGSVAWGLCAAFCCTNAAVDLPPTLALLGSGAALALSWIVTQILLFFRPVKPPISRRVLSFACFPLVAAVAVTFAVTDIGLCGRLWLCENDVTRFAKGIEPETAWDGQKSEQVGFFTVREVDRQGDCVRMITAKDFLDDAGLAYCPVGEPPEIDEDYYRHLWGPWWHWKRSW